MKNKRKSTASERVQEPKEKRSNEKDSTSSNENENLQSEIVVNEYPQKPKKQTSLSSFFFKLNRLKYTINRFLLSDYSS